MLTSELLKRDILLVHSIDQDEVACWDGSAFDRPMGLEIEFREVGAGDGGVDECARLTVPIFAWVRGGKETHVVSLYCDDDGDLDGCQFKSLC